MARRTPKNTGILIATGVVSLILVIGIVALTSSDSPLNNVIRVTALFGYLGVYLTCISSNYIAELTRAFGRSFMKLHHLVAAISLVALTIHAIGVAWNLQSLGAFLPDFSSVERFLLLGGRPSFWLLAVASLTAVLRASVGQHWRTLHWLNYVAFWLGTAHALMIGSSFHLVGLRVIAILMSVALVFLFVWKRTMKWRRRRKRAKK